MKEKNNSLVQLSGLWEYLYNLLRKQKEIMDSNKNKMKLTKTNEGANLNFNFNFNIPLKEEKIDISMANIQLDLTDFRQEGNHQNGQKELSRRDRVTLQMKLKCNTVVDLIDSQLQDHEILPVTKRNTEKELIKTTKIEKPQVEKEKQPQQNQRERTRDMKNTSNQKVDSPKRPQKPQIISPDARLRAKGNKLDFSSMHLYTGCNYVVNSKAHYLKIPSGFFIITNSFECPFRRVSYIHFRVDQSNVSVGITTDKRDFKKYQQNKMKYMTFNFKSHEMNICGSIYQSKAINTLKKNFFCLVDLQNKFFYILNERLQIIRKDNIPENLIGESIYFTLQLREYGRIQFI